MNLFIFWIAAKLLREKIFLWRIISGVFIMTILHCLCLLNFNAYYNFGLSILIFISGIIIVFRPKKFSYLLKLILLVHIIAFAIAGLTMALSYYINFSDLVSTAANFCSQNFSFKILFASTFLSFFIIKIFVAILKKKLLSKQVFAQIEIYLADSKISLNALVDTGNSLCDSITNLPIVIAEFDAIKNIFPPQIKSAILQKNFEALCLSNLNFQFVPFKSIGNENGILICFKPDHVKILSETQKPKIIRHAFVGICNFSLDDNYHGLISPDLLDDKN